VGDRNTMPGAPPNPALSLTGVVTPPLALHLVESAIGPLAIRHSIRGKPEVIGSSVELVPTEVLVWSDVANLLVRSKPEVVQRQHCHARTRTAVNSNDIEEHGRYCQSLEVHHRLSPLLMSYVEVFLRITVGRVLSSANHYFVQSSTFRCLIRLNATSLDMRVSPSERAWAAIIMSMLPSSRPTRSSPARSSP
jgi:hypothetical protein